MNTTDEKKFRRMRVMPGEEDWHPCQESQSLVTCISSVKTQALRGLRTPGMTLIRRHCSARQFFQ